MPRNRSKQASSSEEEGFQQDDDDDDISRNRKQPAKRRKQRTGQSFKTEDSTQDSISHAWASNVCRKSPPTTVAANPGLSPMKKRCPGHPRKYPNPNDIPANSTGGLV